MSTPVIETRNLHKAFGPKVVLDGIDLTVNQGESLVIIGGSGTGKSVLLKCILGLLAPDAGEVLINGEPTAKLSQRAREERMRQFGMLFQGGALFDSLTVWENITFALARSGMKKDARLALAQEKLQAVGLKPETALLRPSELSGGMMKRVSLARAICADPPIIFFDEPTTGLDPIMADVINDLIVACTRSQGKTTLTITHDMHSARKIGTRIAMIYQGKIIHDGPAEQIMESGNPYVDQFVHGRATGPIT
jgi:phospholipid/cholesterol/gamma-HCH transport system ATP-binding protein